jgi:hypothetical protein
MNKHVIVKALGNSAGTGQETARVGDGHRPGDAADATLWYFGPDISQLLVPLLHIASVRILTKKNTK